MRDATVFPRRALTTIRRMPPRRASYPCVLKPLGLSGSRGVIRANNPDEFVAAFRRIKALLRRAAILAGGSIYRGREFAVEGIVTRGALPAAGHLR